MRHARPWTILPALLLAAVAGEALGASADDQPRSADKEARPAVRFTMMDGSIVTAPAIGELAVRTEYGDLTVPGRAVGQLTVGLNSHGDLIERVGTLLAALGLANADTRQAAEKELIKIGPIVRLRVAAAADDANAERKAAVARILKAYVKRPDVAPLPEHDVIRAEAFTIVGRIVRKRFEARTPYGELAFALGQLREAKRLGSPPRPPHPPEDVRLVVELTDGSKLHGASDWRGVRLATPFGEARVTPALLRRLSVDEDKGTFRCEMVSGDVLTGKADTSGSIPLATDLGELSIPVRLLLRLEVRPRMAEGVKRGQVLRFDFNHKAAVVEDLTGNGNCGKVYDAVHTEDGRYGGGYVLDGNGDHITIPNSESLELREAVTLAAWVKLKTLGNSGYGNEHGYIINKGDDLWWNPTFCLGFVKDTGPAWSKHRCRALFNVCRQGAPQRGGGCRVVGETTLEPGRWYHLAGTFDGETARIYVDGRLEAERAYKGPLRSDKAPVHLGGGKLFGTGFGNNFTVAGTIDEVAIWNRALSGDEIESLAGM
jgi:hypothetical protein